jgi:hypothetical protein
MARDLKEFALSRLPAVPSRSGNGAAPPLLKPAFRSGVENRAVVEATVGFGQQGGDCAEANPPLGPMKGS